MLIKSPAWPWVPLFFLLGLLSGELGGTNAISRVSALRSMSESGRLDIDLYRHWSSDWALAPNGHYYSNKAPGAALFGLPVFSVIDFPLRAISEKDDAGRAAPPPLWELWLLCFLMQMLPFSWLVLRISRDLSADGAPPAAVHFFVLAAFFGNTAALYMDSYFGHGLAATLFLAAFWLWRRRNYGVSAFFLGAALLTDYGTACALPLFLACTVCRERAVRPLARMALGALPMGVLWAWYHQAAFGSPLTLATFFSNPEILPAAEDNAVHALHTGLPGWPGLFGLVVGRARGLLFTQPWVLGVFALPFARWSRGCRESAIILAGSLALLVAVTAGTPAWHGGGSLGPRYLSVLFPAIACCLALAWTDIPSWANRALWGALLISLAFRALVLPFDVIPPLAPIWDFHFAQLVRAPWHSREFVVFLGGVSASLATALRVATREKLVWQGLSQTGDLRIAVALALAISAFIYSPLLGSGLPLERDDIALLAPLYGVSGPADWLSAWQSGHILDFAPVRDLSFLLDLQLGALLGLPVFHASQLVLWLIYLALAVSLLRMAGPARVPRAAWVALLSLHPAHVSSVGWISSRKHLLAACFCLGATLHVLRSGEAVRRFRTIALYVLSVLSHPIFIFWPIWVFHSCWSKKKWGALRAGAALGPLLGAMAVLGGVNAWYYLKLYPLATGGIGKFSPAPDSGLGIPLLAFGRALCNLLLPVKISPVDYFPGAPENLFGILLLVLFGAAVIKLLPKPLALSWGMFSILPLLLVNLRSTRVFLSDTYLLLPALGVWILASNLAERAAICRRANAFALAGVAALLAASALPASRALAGSFLGMDRLFELAYSKEATPQVRLVHGGHLLERGFFREAATLALEEKDRQPELASFLFAEAIASDPALSAEARLSALNSWPSELAPYRYYVARALAEGGRCGEALHELRPFLGEPGGFLRVREQALALARHCAQNGGARPGDFR